MNVIPTAQRGRRQSISVRVGLAVQVEPIILANSIFHPQILAEVDMELSTF